MGESPCVPFDDGTWVPTWKPRVEVQPNATQFGHQEPSPRSSEPREYLALDEECRAHERTFFTSTLIPVPVEPVLAPAAEILVQTIQEKLDQDRDEALEYGEEPPSQQSIKVCLQLSNLFAPHLAFLPGIKWGAFTEDSGGISLVLQSLVSDRRLNCRIAPDGVTISALKIDEHMIAKASEVLLDNKNTWRELTEWVTSRG